MGKMRRGHKRGKSRLVEGEHCPYCNRITGGPYHGEVMTAERAKAENVDFTSMTCSSPECQAQMYEAFLGNARARHPEMSDEEFDAAIAEIDRQNGIEPS